MLMGLTCPKAEYNVKNDVMAANGTKVAAIWQRPSSEGVLTPALGLC